MFHLCGWYYESIFSPFYLCHADGDRVFKAELASHDNLWLSQSITASIAVVEELSSEDAAEFEERVTTRKAKRAKQLLESASKAPTSLFSAPTRTRRLIPQSPGGACRKRRRKKLAMHAHWHA